MVHVRPHPGSSSPEVSRRMSAARGRDTKPEVDVRRILYARGLRYRVAFPVPGHPRRTIDIAFTRAKVAVFMDGCFWHSCPEHGTIPAANRDWWVAKLEANALRDIGSTSLLEGQGWRVLRFWEHEAPESVAEIVFMSVTAR